MEAAAPFAAVPPHIAFEYVRTRNPAHLLLRLEVSAAVSCWCMHRGRRASMLLSLCTLHVRTVRVCVPPVRITILGRSTDEFLLCALHMHVCTTKVDVQVK